MPVELIDGIKNSVDCNIYFFGDAVGVADMYLTVALSAAALIGIYVLIQYLKRKKRPYDNGRAGQGRKQKTIKA